MKSKNKFILWLTITLTSEMLFSGWGRTDRETNNEQNRRAKMNICRHCNEPFIETVPHKLYCSIRCQQDWHLHQRKLARQQKLFAKLKRQDEAIASGAPLVEEQYGTPEQREKAREILDKAMASLEYAKRQPKEKHLWRHRRVINGGPELTKEQQRELAEQAMSQYAAAGKFVRRA